MNRIVNSVGCCKRRNFFVSELIGGNLDESGHTAFEGTIGERSGLFLIGWGGIVFLENPVYTWSGNVCVIVDRWVDLEIKAVPEGDSK